jgi:hypothetical protein
LRLLLSYSPVIFTNVKAATLAGVDLCQSY